MLYLLDMLLAYSDQVLFCCKMLRSYIPLLSNPYQIMYSSVLGACVCSSFFVAAGKHLYCEDRLGGGCLQWPPALPPPPSPQALKRRRVGDGHHWVLRSSPKPLELMQKGCTLKSLTSLDKESRPCVLGDNIIWSFPSVSSLSDYSIWRSCRLS